jgi:hypothetical protein
VLYIDTSVLLVYTLTQAVEKARFPATETFFAKIAAGSLLGATSFYALQEVYVFALDNAPDFPTGAAFGKAALEKILALPLQIFPFVSRLERKLQARKFSALRDSSDVPHAIAGQSLTLFLTRHQTTSFEVSQPGWNAGESGTKENSTPGIDCLLRIPRHETIKKKLKRELRLEYED